MNASASLPTFAVVGHPNKGKSSIVATMAGDQTIAISPIPGTTTQANAYTAYADDATPLYALIDTPGFQRARAAFEWIKSHETTADQHPEVVREFAKIHAQDPKHHDEVELLRPILDGAAILYVVDGSAPFGPQYEAEMEILRWTGRPSMALINPIGQADHIETWKSALSQFFRIVRVFDALDAPFEKRLALLEAFGQLDESWTQPMQRAVDQLGTQRDRQRKAAADAIVEMLLDVLSLQTQRKLGDKPATPAMKDDLAQELREKVRECETRCQERIAHLYRFDQLQVAQDPLEIIGKDLFSESTWSRFGLSRRELTKLGLVSGLAAGGTVGGAIDASLGGTSLLAGAFTGALIGGTSGALTGWWSAGRLAKVRVMNQPMGGKQLVCGPVRNLAPLFVLLGRAVAYQKLLALRTHADRRDAVINTPTEWDDADKKSLASLIGKLTRQRSVSDETLDKLRTTLDRLLT